jgi:hypothetical protein
MVAGAATLLAWIGSRAATQNYALELEIEQHRRATGKPTPCAAASGAPTAAPTCADDASRPIRNQRRRSAPPPSQQAM